MTPDERRDETLRVIARVAEVEEESLGPETELVAHLGIDSPRALQLLVELEERLEVELDDEAVAELQTVGDLLALVEAPPPG